VDSPAVANTDGKGLSRPSQGSLSRVSQSSPGERVQLVDPAVGDELYDGWVL
jgi:hypothetical protein